MVLKAECKELRESLKARTAELQAANVRLARQDGAHSLSLKAWEAERGSLEATIAGLRHELKGAHESHEAEAMMAGRYAEALGVDGAVMTCGMLDAGWALATRHDARWRGLGRRLASLLLFV